MNCPKCGAKTRVISTRKYNNMIYRYRKCIECGYNLTTKEERAVIYMPKEEKDK